MKTALGVTAALALSVAVLPAASAGPAVSAEPDFASIALTPGKGWSGTGSWSTRPGQYRQEFTVGITNIAGHEERGLDLFVSFPTDRLEVTSYEGRDWNCWDVNDGPGAEGIRCTQNHLIVDKEAWPALKIHTSVVKWEHYNDSIDVYAEAGGHAKVHAGQLFKIDTST
ncbi:hypothetical protein ACFWNN_42025 [Lentzea sp. NPDC058450]|uniref:hypothetical protein n=1 Tax=Lentzea sp. NPDC058450 TaxID=3346505 RepID=UPI0036533295